MSASPVTLKAFTEAAADAVARAIAGVQREAERAEALRAAEHRAFMAEQREALAGLTRQVSDRLAAVRDGLDGKDGRDGADGRDGKDGAPGADGKDGIDGTNGTNGKDGLDGKNGAGGENGRDGKDGVDGAAGRDGADGRDGIDGANGQDGINGIDGKDGANGQDGRDGRDGLDGKDGADGAAGSDGLNGADGKDAYPGEARGLFNSEATYRALDVVSFNGSEWRAKRDDPGELPGDGWMLSASRGKRGEKGDRGDIGREGAAGSAIIASYVDTDDLKLVLTRDDGTEIKADLYDLAQLVRAS
jgi:Ca2+-binding RTX toxin-like protein